MEKSVIIFGDHPLAHDIKQQYDAKRFTVNCRDSMSIDGIDLDDYDEICLLPNAIEKNACDKIAKPSELDRLTIEFLQTMAKSYNMNSHASRLKVCHLLIHCSSTMSIFLATGFSEEIKRAFDVNPFTVEDNWAKTVLVHLPGISNPYPMLDRKPIQKDSDNKVHVVICGFDSYAESIATHVALIAHYPNYKSTDEKPIRTRITIIDTQTNKSFRSYRARYQHLFNHSFYRMVDVEKRTSTIHNPEYKDIQKDFVDIEWEFVKGSTVDEVVRNRITKWIDDPKRLVSIFISSGEDDKDFITSTSLPYQIYEKATPVFVRQNSRNKVDAIKTCNSFQNLYAFGMLENGYNIEQPLLNMAKLLSYFYACSYSDEGVPTELPIDKVEKAWQQEKSLKMKLSNIFNIMTVSAKMHSLGRNPDDARAYYALTQKEIETLAATEHNRWSVERLIMGTRPCTDKEKEEIRQNILKNIEYRGTTHTEDEEEPANLKKEYKEIKHFDLCAYEDLEMDETGKLASTYDYDLTACIPLLMRSFYQHYHDDNKQE